MYRILLIDDPTATRAVTGVESLLGEAGLSLQRLPPRQADLPPWAQYPETAGEQDLAWLMPLSACPLQLPDSWRITALSARHPAGLYLTMPNSLREPSAPLGLPEGAEVDADPLAAAYLHSLVPSVRITSGAAARVGRWPDEAAPLQADRHEQMLHPREFPPAAGSGIWAWITHPDALPLRRVLKILHHPETARISNVERELARRFHQAGIDLAGIHAETDQQGLIRLWMAWSDPRDGRLQRTGISSATHLGLEDLAWAKTGLNFDTIPSSPS
jgi:hypothetical protein